MKLADELKRGRDACRRREWNTAYELLSLADRQAPLGSENLELLATAAYLTGRDAEFQSYLNRAHRVDLEAGDRKRAARRAFWLSLDLFLRGEIGQASGWLSKAQRLIEGEDCVEQGYVLLPLSEQRLVECNGDEAYSISARAAEIGERFGDGDLVACARHLQGRALLGRQQVPAGLALLDEAMLPVVAGELSPIMTGLIYCSVIDACHQVYALSRAGEWTAALTTWCEQNAQMVAFTSACLVHRAEVMQFHGAWSDAMAEASRACERSGRATGWAVPAPALYQRAELHRLRGDFALAEEAYRAAGQSGCEPQPGLALLRMAQGRTDVACAAIRRVLGAATGPLPRAKMLPAFVEIMLEAGHFEEARSACVELQEIGTHFNTDVLRALAAQAQGAVELAEGNARAALAPLNRALEAWQTVEAPYEAARVRILIGLACRALGDEEAGKLGLEAARIALERLGAAADLARLDMLEKAAAPRGRHGLTTRELEVLRLIIAGKTNKSIADELTLSERTIDRHVSNILTKLDVPSRAAATAYAYTHKLF
jgi:DNA-binding CsgD family transcriptional regulator